MDPKDVSLPIKVHLKLLWQLVKTEEDIQFGLFLFMLFMFGFGMALCTPAFMAGFISNFIMKIFLTITYTAAFVGAFVLLMKVWTENIEPSPRATSLWSLGRGAPHGFLPAPDPAYPQTNIDS